MLKMPAGSSFGCIDTSKVLADSSTVAPFNAETNVNAWISAISGTSSERRATSTTCSVTPGSKTATPSDGSKSPPPSFPPSLC